MSRKVPSVGRTVHYVAQDGRDPSQLTHWPAIVVSAGEADGDIPTLMACTPYPRTYWAVPYDGEARAAGSWHWPEYVPEVDDADAPQTPSAAR